MFLPSVPNPGSIPHNGLSLGATAPDYTWNGPGQVAVTGLLTICSNSVPSTTASPHSQAPGTSGWKGWLEGPSISWQNPARLFESMTGCQQLVWHVRRAQPLAFHCELIPNSTTFSEPGWHYKAKGKGDGKKRRTPRWPLTSADWSVMHTENLPVRRDDPNRWTKIHCWKWFVPPKWQNRWNSINLLAY